MAAGEGFRSQEIVDAIASHAKSTGLFDRSLKHEPKSKPARGLTFACWVDRIEPARGRSGLRYTDVRVVMKARIYTAMLQNPQDGIDPAVMNAVDVLLGAYTGDFGLGADDRFVDLLGMTQGHPLYGESGYINIDNMVFRVFTITVPVICENAWEQRQ